MKYRVDELHNLYKIACQLEYKKEQCKAHNYIQLAQAYDKILITVNKEIKTLHCTLFKKGGEDNE
jgi:RNase P subunit RPR2